MVTFTKYRSPLRLHAVWDRLYSAGNFSPFQSWVSNWWFYLVYHLKGSRLKYRPSFLCFSDENNMCILPIAVDAHQKRVIDFSVGGPIDYYDAICSTHDSSFITACITLLRDLYPDYEICFSNINQDSLLFSAFKGDSFRPQTICAKIEFASNSYEEYFKSLSKHQRQNIRTGYNKLAREGIEWRLEKYDATNPMPRGVWKQCLQMYNERCNMKNRRGNGLKQYWAGWKNSQVDLMNILIRKWNRVVSFVLFMNGQPVAYMSGMCNNQHDTFFVPRLSCSNQYLRYDAGILMLNESIKLLLNEGIRTIDLTRGDEPYKFAMGAVPHTNYVVQL